MTIISVIDSEVGGATVELIPACIDVVVMGGGRPPVVGPGLPEVVALGGLLDVIFAPVVWVGVV